MSFTRDLAFGKSWEQVAKKYIPEDEVVVECPEGLFKQYDFKTNMSAYEVKSDRLAYKYNYSSMFIEYENNGKPSGINATTADYWFYFMVKPEGGYIVYEIPVNLLKEECKKNVRTVSGGDGMRSKGYIIPGKVFQNLILPPLG